MASTSPASAGRSTTGAPNPLAQASQTHAHRAGTFGVSPEHFENFVADHGAVYAKSASADHRLNSLNDHDGVLVLPARSGGAMVAERFAVVKDQVDGQDRMFVKGYGDRVLEFAAFENALARINNLDDGDVEQYQEALRAQLRSALGSKPWENPLMETPLRSEVLRLSMASGLTLRRDDKESSTKLMPLPCNPTPVPKAASWANSEGALCPGAGPVLANGTRRYQLDWNKVENRLLGFQNNEGDTERQPSVMNHSVPGQMAPVLVNGPVLFEIQGIKRWQLVGPASEQSGVKFGTVQRAAEAVGSAVRAAAGYGGHLAAGGEGQDVQAVLQHLKPGAHIRLTTEDGAVHDLKLTQQGISLSLAPSTGRFTSGRNTPNAANAAFGVGMDVSMAAGPRDARTVAADVNVYSYQGRLTGRHGSASGMADPELLLSTGEPLKAGTFLHANGNATSVAHAAARLLTFQPNLGGEGGRVGTVAARTANVATLAATKFATTALTAMIGNAMKGDDGVFFDGAGQISGVGSGRASMGKIAGATALVVVSQELITALKDALMEAVPTSWKNPTNPILNKGGTLLSTTAEELIRLEVNLGIQKMLGLRQGVAADHGVLAASAAIKGVIETLRYSIGGPEVRPNVHMVLDTLQAAQYQLLRATGIAIETGEGKLRLANWKEAAASRFVLRGYDQVLAPAVAHLLNNGGVLGENASAFDHQIARERKIDGYFGKLKNALAQAMQEDGDWRPMASLVSPGVVAQMRQNMNELMGDGHAMATLRANTEGALVAQGRKPADTEFFSAKGLAQERLKQMLNRVDLYAVNVNAALDMFSAAYHRIAGTPAQEPDLEAALPEHNVARAVSHRQLDDPDASLQHLQATERAQEARIEGAQARSEGRADVLPLGSQPTTNSLTEASAGLRRFTLAQHDRLQAAAAHPQPADDEIDVRLDAGAPLSAAVAQPVQPDYAGRARPVARRRPEGQLPAQRGRLPLEATTFSRALQAGSLNQHNPMRRAHGLADTLARQARQAAPAGPRRPLPLSPAMQQRIELAVRHYTVESQFFHYPLRWQVTGQPQLIPVAPGVDLAYNVLNKPGNLKGAKGEHVDPIEALYANIGCARAPKFPADLLRAVVTEAAYKDIQGQAEQTSQLSTGGSKGVLTEIFSASASAAVAADFNVPISGYGAAPRANSQRLDVVQQTGVNVAKFSDLAQAEVIMMPGAMFSVEHIDPNAGKLPPDLRPSLPGGRADQDIGQVVYMRAVNTYVLEQRYDRFLRDPGTPPLDGTPMIEPDTGQFYRYAAHPEPGQAVFDPAPEGVQARAAGSAPRGGLVFADETKNYFLGRPLEFASNPPTQQALWRHPYTAETAKRATKDAVHAAIVRGDPIVEHLNEAVQNLHHEHFRREGGFYETRPLPGGGQAYVNPRAQGEANRAAQRKAGAELIAGRLSDPNAFQSEHDAVDTEMLAWLTTSLLRQPIVLMPVGEPAGPGREPLLIDKTYDKVDLTAQPLTSKPPPAVVIGVGSDGYYAMQHVDGQFVPTHKVEGRSSGKSAENLLHAFLRAGPLPARHYPQPAPDASPEEQRFLPDNFADRSARALFEKLRSFAATDYLVLQQAMVARHGDAMVRGA